MCESQDFTHCAKQERDRKFLPISLLKTYQVMLQNAIGQYLICIKPT